MEERLRKFGHLVDIGNFTQAAQELHVSQPALTMAVHKLERELDAVLLIRRSGWLELTAAGKIAYQSARELNMVSSGLIQRLTALYDQSPILTIGMIDSVAHVVFSAARVNPLEHRVNLSVVVNNSRYLRRRAEQGSIDIAFMTKPYISAPTTSHIEYIASEPLVLICHKAQQSTLQEALRRHSLPGFISYDRASTTCQIVTNAFRSYHIQADIKIYSTSPEVMVKLAVQQQAATMVPYWLVREMLHQHEFVLLGTPRPLIVRRQIVSLRKRETSLTETAEKYVRSIIETIKTYSNIAERELGATLSELNQQP